MAGRAAPRRQLLGRARRLCQPAKAPAPLRDVQQINQSRAAELSVAEGLRSERAAVEVCLARGHLASRGALDSGSTAGLAGQAGGGSPPCRCATQPGFTVESHGWVCLHVAAEAGATPGYPHRLGSFIQELPAQITPACYGGRHMDLGAREAAPDQPPPGLAPANDWSSTATASHFPLSRSSPADAPGLPFCPWIRLCCRLAS